jgi:hypothetical protein
MIGLFLYDYRHDINKVPEVAGIDTSILIDSQPQGAALAAATEASHWIVHLNTKELDAIEDQSLDISIYPDAQIIFCVTTQRPGHPFHERSHTIVKQGMRSRYILYARYVEALNDRGTVGALYKAAAAEAEAVVKGEWKNVPADFRRLFYKGSNTYLSALAILFQGYLAVHAEYRGEKDWDDAHIQEALETMGWNRFRTQAGQSSVVEGLGSHKEVVRNREWFLSPFMTPHRSDQDARFDHAIFRNRVLEEWNDGDSNAPREFLEKLLLDLEKTEPELIKSPQFIATAYLEISARLTRK